MSQNNGKVIVSLLAGATAGVVAGLLLAPETGEETRKSLSAGANRLWNGPAGQFLKDTLARFTGPTDPEAGTPAHSDQQAADSLLSDMRSPEPGDLATPAGAGNGQSVAGNGQSVAGADDETEFPAGRTV